MLTIVTDQKASKLLSKFPLPDEHASFFERGCNPRQNGPSLSGHRVALLDEDLEHHAPEERETQLVFVRGAENLSL